MVSNGARLDEIKSLYKKFKVKKLLKIIIMIDRVGILIDMFVFKKNMWIVFNINIIIFVLLFVTSMKTMIQNLKTETIALILKEDKDRK